MPGTHISIRVTEQRRANLDALAAIIRSDSDAATIDFALGFALAQLSGKEIDMGRKDGSMREAARARVAGSPRLSRHSAVILHEWEREGEDHWRWVAEAPVREIVDWAQAVEKQAE